MTDIEIQRLRENGISEATIQEFIAESKTKSDKGPVQPQPSVQSTLPEIDPNTPSETFIAAKQSGTPTMGQGPSATQTATEIGVAVAPYAGAAALGAAGLYGAGVAREAFKTMREANIEKAKHTQLQYDKLAAAQEKAAGRVPTTNVPKPTTVPTGSNVVQFPTQGPVSPPNTIPQATPQKPTMLQRGMDIASKMRELAAKRVTMPGGFRIPVGGTIAGTLGALSYSPDLGPKVPQSGPFRGMEINPQTGRPFTEQELAMYR